MLMNFTRREFVSASVAVGAASLLGFPLQASNQNELTIQQVMDLILKSVPGAPFQQTVDTIKSGDALQRVTGIVTTMFATVSVIRKAIELKANFIIAHEPTFYNHTDSTDWIENDSVFRLKKELLEKNKIVVWRFHDYIHSMRPDGVIIGVLQTLGWEKYYDANNPPMVRVASITVREVIALVKSKLGIKSMRMVGDLSQSCERIAILPGAPGGRRQISVLQNEKPDLMLCGEVAEWETSEYIRDAVALGEKRSLIILGHAFSEEPGMKWMASWLQPQVRNIKVTHVASNEPFTWV
jgi:putative NIF3 family GTP cyclohydrolase 1 type 2